MALWRYRHEGLPYARDSVMLPQLEQRRWRRQIQPIFFVPPCLLIPGCHRAPCEWCRMWHGVLPYFVGYSLHLLAKMSPWLTYAVARPA
jgi:hypothetical protein